MGRILLTIIISITIIRSVAGQVSVSGYVTDAQNGERLAGATIYDMNTHNGVAANGYGFFSIRVVSLETARLRVSFVGYHSLDVLLNSIKDTLIDVRLVAGHELAEVKITAYRPIEERNEMGVLSLSMQNVKRLPAIGGEADLMKSLQLMPGVSQGNELSAGLYVRGGSPDQNLMIIDDVPVYYVNHMGGFVSTFNADAINSVTLIKGGFPARYGSRLSSVMDVKLKEGNKEQFQGEGALGLISGKLTLQGPIEKGKASYLVSVRRMWIDAFMRPLTSLIEGSPSIGYHFYDLNAKVNWQVGQRDHLYLSFYSGDDRLIFSLNDKENRRNENKTLRWGNNVGALRWNHLFNPRLFSNITIAATRYRHATDDDVRGDSVYHHQGFVSSITDVMLKTDWDYNATNNWLVRFGASATLHDFLPSSTTLKSSDSYYQSLAPMFVSNRYRSQEYSAYVENDIRLSSRISGNIGGRYSLYEIEGVKYSSIEPRLLFNVRMLPHLSVKAGYSHMKQYVHLLTTGGVEMPVDYWVPATDLLPPSMSKQLNLGFEHSFRNNMFEASVEGYYKTLSQLIEFSEGQSYLGGTGEWQRKVDAGGTGISKGVEFFLQKMKGDVTGWIGYTLSKSERIFEQQNNGVSFPFKYDRRHDISVVFMYQIKENIDFSASWVYATGSPYTLAVAAFNSVYDPSAFVDTQEDFVLETAFIYSDKHGYRMRPYHRLDVGMNFRKKKKWGERIWNISIYNLYNRQNPYYYYWDSYSAKENKTTPKLKQQSLFPIIPSVSYGFNF